MWHGTTSTSTLTRSQTVQRQHPQPCRTLEEADDAVGGLRLQFPADVRDGYSGLTAPQGCSSLEGRAILGLARSRHLQYLDSDGRWRGDPTGDLGRIERQQAIGIAMLGALSRIDTTSPTQLAELLEAIGRNLTIDARTEPGELLDLFRGIAGSEIIQLRLSVVDAVVDGAKALKAGPVSNEVLEPFGAVDRLPHAEPDPGAPSDPVQGETAPAPEPLVPTPC